MWPAAEARGNRGQRPQCIWNLTFRAEIGVAHNESLLRSFWCPRDAPHCIFVGNGPSSTGHLTSPKAITPALIDKKTPIADFLTAGCPRGRCQELVIRLPLLRMNADPAITGSKVPLARSMRRPRLATTLNRSRWGLLQARTPQSPTSWGACMAPRRPPSRA